LAFNLYCIHGIFVWPNLIIRYTESFSCRTNASSTSGVFNLFLIMNLFLFRILYYTWMWLAVVGDVSQVWLTLVFSCVKCASLWVDSIIVVLVVILELNGYCENHVQIRDKSRNLISGVKIISQEKYKLLFVINVIITILFYTKLLFLIS
jgi:hypothetical protein